MTTLAPANSALSARLRPFVVALEEHRAEFDCGAFGWVIGREDRLDPLRLASVRFLEILRRLDAATFGPEGMPMPRWVFFDGAELPGGIVGFGADAGTLSLHTRQLLEVEASYQGLVPLSMFIAIPTHEPGTWMAHNLASIAPQVPDACRRDAGGGRRGRIDQGLWTSGLPCAASDRRDPVELERAVDPHPAGPSQSRERLDTCAQRAVDPDLRCGRDRKRPAQSGA